MKKIHFEKKNLTNTFFEDVQFFLFAEAGAVGDPGVIEFIKADGHLYRLNTIYEDYTFEEIAEVFPVFGKCHFGFLRTDCRVTDDWNYVNLGMGNHLLVRTGLFTDYMKKIGKDLYGGRIYKSWARHAEEVMQSKGAKNMKNNSTELVFILDRSGSMSGLEADTIGGFNSMIEKQKAEEGECLVSTVLFNNASKVIHDRVKLSRIRPMTKRDYSTFGGTALLDAVGGAIRHIGNIHKYARPEDVPAHTMFIITTDGMENASRTYSSEQVKHMIERQKAQYGWEFLFIGANIDAVETAARYGIGEDRAVNYNADKQGTEILYASVSEAVHNVRSCAGIPRGWSAGIAEDHKKRGGKPGK